MGIDVHSLNFLRYAAKKKALGRVATIGRQSLMVRSAQIGTETFCEQFLTTHLGAHVVHSYDYSDYEGATHVVDMNQPLRTEERYDTVVDCGTTEHIFNVSQALRNISMLGASGAQLIHVLPANNFCGHGLWQFSPELFFSLYSEANGYAETEVFLADLGNSRSWFGVEQPRNGERAMVVSNSPLYVLCRTRKVSAASHESVQQSDYVYAWSRTSQTTRTPNKIVETAKGIVKKNSIVYRSALAVYGKAQGSIRAFANSARLSNRNRHLRKQSVSELLASQTTIQPRLGWSIASEKRS
jgi:hypothetical protein